MKKLTKIAIVTIWLLWACEVASAGCLLSWGDNDFNRCDVPDGNDFIDISAGQYHGLALRSNGTLIAWGNNTLGQCDVPDGNNFVDVDAGSGHSVALDNQGYIHAWGNNYHGQCNVSTEPNWVKIDAKGLTVALKSDGTVGVWGYSDPNDLNDPPAGTYKDIKSGGGWGLLLNNDNTLSSWGQNHKGQRNLPAGTFKAIGCGTLHGLAVDTNGYLHAWGWNDYGQCDVPDGNDYIFVDGYQYHSIAQKEDGSFVLWGGFPDDSNDPNFREIPTDVNDFVVIESGHRFCLGLTSDKSYTLTLLTNPVDINTTIPSAGTYYCYVGQKVYVNAPQCPLCPWVWAFDYWEGDIDDSNEQGQFITLNQDKTITAVYTQLSKECGDLCHPVLTGDLNEDCYINLEDFVLYAAQWLSCTHPDCD